MVIEDDRRSLELLSLYLEDAGVRIVSAHDGSSGLAAVRASAAAAVMLDIRLPGMDGWQVLKALKADPATAQTPVVVITILDERPHALELGAADYLVKPVSREGRTRLAYRSRGAAGAHRKPGRPGGDVSEALVLVVEDNERNLKLVRDVLEFAGYQVISATTAEDGVSLALERSPDLVLMDLQLPGMDGVEALRQLRDSPQTKHLPIVAVTAFAMREDRERALDAGFDGYLEKPISVRALPAQVRSFLASDEVPQ